MVKICKIGHFSAVGTVLGCRGGASMHRGGTSMHRGGTSMHRGGASMGSFTPKTLFWSFSDHFSGPEPYPLAIDQLKLSRIEI